MAAEIATRGETGTIVLDVRRGDGPSECFNYTMASIASTDRLIHSSPEIAAIAVQAIVKAHAALRQNIRYATEVGRRLFPPFEANLIADLVRRDLPYYDASISQAAVYGLNRFARDSGILNREVAYENVVAKQFSHLWKA
jgi:uncharacterized protein (DUF952 family)